MPDNPWTLFHLGEAVLREGNPARAAATWERAFAWYRTRRLLPEYELYVKLGRVLRDRLGRPEAACAVFREAFARYPDRVHLLIELSGVHALCGRPREARRLVRQAIRLAKKHYMKIPSWVDRDAAVVLRWRLKDPRAALAHLEQAVRRPMPPPARIRPGHPSASNFSNTQAVSSLSEGWITMESLMGEYVPICGHRILIPSIALALAARSSCILHS